MAMSHLMLHGIEVTRPSQDHGIADTAACKRWRELLADCAAWKGPGHAMLEKHAALLEGDIPPALREHAAARAVVSPVAEPLLRLVLGPWGGDPKRSVSPQYRLHLLTTLLSEKGDDPLRARRVLVALLDGVSAAELNDRHAAWDGIGLVDWIARTARTTAAWALPDLVALGLDLSCPVSGRSAIRLAMDCAPNDEKPGVLLLPLLQAGAAFPEVTASGESEFHQAFRYVCGDQLAAEWLTVLVEHGAPVDVPSRPDGLNALHEACRDVTGVLGIMYGADRLAKAGVRWDAPTPQGDRAPHIAACTAETLAWWSYLIDKECGWSERNLYGQSPFDVAAERLGMSKLLDMVESVSRRLLIAGFPGAFAVFPPECLMTGTDEHPRPGDREMRSPFARAFVDWARGVDKDRNGEACLWIRKNTGVSGILREALAVGDLWAQYRVHCAANASVQQADAAAVGGELAGKVADAWCASASLGIDPFKMLSRDLDEAEHAAALMIHMFGAAAYDGAIEPEKLTATNMFGLATADGAAEVAKISARNRSAIKTPNASLRGFWAAYRADACIADGDVSASAGERQAAYLDQAYSRRPAWLTTPPQSRRDAPDPLRWELYGEKALQELADVDETDETKRFIKRTKNAGSAHRVRPLAPVAPLMAELDALAADFPHFAEMIEHIADHVHLQQAGDGSFFLPPTLMSGPPGVGKTFFSERVAACVGTAYRIVQMQTITASFILTGSSSQWSGGRPGLVFDLLNKGSTANPIVLLDEIDKCGGDKRYQPDLTLLTLLEPGNARRFADECIPLVMDARRIVWLATANDLSAMTEPLRTRFETVHVPEPGERERRALCAGVYRALIADNAWGSALEPKLPEATIDMLATAQGAGATRRLRSVLIKGCARALRAGRREVTVADLPLSSPQERRRWDLPSPQKRPIAA